ncbi:MAG: GNAT family N-acetyltransferase, partial [Flavobacteriaceae bacterium]
FETERLFARALNLNDAKFLYPILSDMETMKYYPAPYDMKGVKNWINRSIENYKKNGFGLWAILLKETNEFIGQCGITLQNINGNIVPEIGYHIRKDFWNQGLTLQFLKTNFAYRLIYKTCIGRSRNIKTMHIVSLPNIL